MARRGTKGNPFGLGEVVVRMTPTPDGRYRNNRGVVIEIKTEELNSYWERSYAPIRYLVKFNDDRQHWYQARDLRQLSKDERLP